MPLVELLKLYLDSAELLRRIICDTVILSGSEVCCLIVFTPSLTITGPGAPGRTAQVILAQPLSMLVLCYLKGSGILLNIMLVFKDNFYTLFKRILLYFG